MTTQTLKLPERRGISGPVTKAVQKRARLIYLLIAALGMASVLALPQPATTAFGLGLIFPAAGFLYTGQWLALIVTVLVLAFTLFFWFAAGNIVAPGVVWAASALYAAAYAYGNTDDAAYNEIAIWVVPLAVGGVWAYAKYTENRRNEEALKLKEERNAYLSMIEVVPVPAPEFDHQYWGELKPDDLECSRFLLDRALQPPDEFNGFEWHEFQFQFAAVRYQINYLLYSLQSQQQRFTPSFHGYVNEAQRRLIEKLLDRRVWGYWRWESLWGHFTTDFDPMLRDNIMLSGWSGLTIGNYISTTGDQRYCAPGSLPFTYGDKTYPYDFHAIAEAIFQNFRKSPWCLYACEPNWVYNMCNESGLVVLKQHDRLFGSTYFSEIGERFTRNIEREFMTPDGRVIALRSSRLGFSLPFLTSPTADAQFSLWGNPLFPDLAQRVWQIMRREFMRIDDDGFVEIDTKSWDTIDGGNYRKSNISTMFNARMAAQEFGDREFADAVMKTMNQQHQLVTKDGHRYFDDGSVLANAMCCWGNVLNKNGLADLINHDLPDNIRKGPILSGCSYPEVLVAKAVSHTGRNLELVLYPGTEKRRQSLLIERLEAGRQYNISGAIEPAATADSGGGLSLQVELRGRTEILIEPVENQ